MERRIIEELLFSSDSSDDENLHINNYLYEDNENHERPKIRDYVAGVVDRYSEEEFRENFRMYRRTFNYILELIEDKIATNAIQVGRQTISAKIQLLMAIWYFATPDSYRSICGRFNIGKATGLRTVRRVTEALIELSPSIIKWPSGDYVDIVKNNFQRMGFPNTIGCVDGSYIPIPLPKNHGISYICRKNFPAIIVQGVCDHRLLFTHCYAGEVGSVHDATVLRHSEVWGYIMQEADEKFPDNSHIIGDKAYPCLPQLLTLYKDNGRLTRQQRHYNYRLSAARSSIERAFGLLKKRMRCLKFFDVRKIEWIPKYIIACCVLHNICILQEDIIDFDFDEDEDVENNFPIDNPEDRAVRLRGTAKRDEICRELAAQ